ncbi:hypothetical protein SELMODRAFT_419806 [Selaginella moellendorffii]|uniref:Uncharacterized protein n=1 Tax=Selaginella moellendorffii TaxID=88036 RepID=D8SAL8_SELML|nr:hypothetical protein SELMODRAFT_419806 [Selaginella moellendorffii]
MIDFSCGAVVACRFFLRSFCTGLRSSSAPRPGGHESSCDTRPAPQLVLRYNRANTSLLLFGDCWYNGGGHGWSMREFGALLESGHSQTECTNQTRKHCNGTYWSCPYSRRDIDYDPDMAPSIRELEQCQIRSIEITGVLSTLELGLRYNNWDGGACIWDTSVETDRERIIEEHLEIKYDRAATGCVLVSVPTLAVKYKALKWILKTDVTSFPLELLPDEFISNSSTKVKDKAMLELAEAVLQGIKRCVIVDLRGIGIMRKVGLFFPGATVDKMLDKMLEYIGKEPVPVGEFLKEDDWKELGVENVAREEVVCFTIDLEWTVELLLEFKLDKSIEQASSLPVRSHQLSNRVRHGNYFWKPSSDRDADFPNEDFSTPPKRTYKAPDPGSCVLPDGSCKWNSIYEHLA